MKIAVYSGSFNPLHIGHMAIMEYLTRDRDYDWVYLVVSPKNPIKDSISADSARDRFNAAVEAVKRHPELHVWVDDIELEMEPPQYTIKTLDALKLREPENDFTLVMGADNLQGIRRWRDFPRILSEYGVAVYPRQGFDLEQIKRQLIEECRYFPAPYVLDANEMAPEGMRSLEETLRDTYNIEIIDAPIVDISSTEIREGIAAGKDMSAWLM
ncbi:MAG: nicotinate (nicotinamide) nucleotide adenylyltransferase [Bacteroidales bacterium]|jgi:nicotinate-nucleotide adenylyltransferase|nr:nicotinate (nicotinamide) nucleotide adenylyltransferase [Bacteroidales bacterium]